MTRPAAIVMCGGRGSRLWPLSRNSRPKYLIDVGGRGTLLSMTLHRTLGVIDPDRIVVVTSQEHHDATAAVAAGFGIETIVSEPSPRDTTAAVVLGVREIERRWGPSRVLSLPADHDIDDDAAWGSSIRLALQAPEDTIATVGIYPSTPSVDYGYIETNASYGERLAVERFHEKPDLSTAEGYLADGGFLWNTAMMSFTTAGLLAALSIAAKDVIESVDAAVVDGSLDPARWSAVRSIALEHSLMEPAAAAGLVQVVPATFGWRDLGSWSELAPLLPQARDVVTTEPDTWVVASPGTTPRRYVNAGVPDLIVVDTGDVLLVTTGHSASQVKQAVALAETAGWKDAL